MLHIYHSLVSTPVGDMMMLASGEALCALEFVSPQRSTRLDARRRRWFPAHTIDEGETPVGALTRAWLDDYFAAPGTGPAGEGRDTAHGTRLPPVALYGTEFERRVWEALLRIPAGETSSYGALARELGSPGASRAVGLANGSNPIAIVVPCHRVIGSSGALTGYGGGLDRKRWLLAHERSKYSRSLLNATAL